MAAENDIDFSVYDDFLDGWIDGIKYLHGEQCGVFSHQINEVHSEVGDTYNSNVSVLAKFNTVVTISSLFPEGFTSICPVDFEERVISGFIAHWKCSFTDSVAEDIKHFVDFYECYLSGSQNKSNGTLDAFPNMPDISTFFFNHCSAKDVPLLFIMDSPDCISTYQALCAEIAKLHNRDYDQNDKRDHFICQHPVIVVSCPVDKLANFTAEEEIDEIEERNEALEDEIELLTRHNSLLRRQLSDLHDNDDDEDVMDD